MRVRVPRAEQVERNRALVLDAARAEFLERGYGGATLDAIAEKAGFSKGVVYSQFASKADLFLALLEQRVEERADENDRVARSRMGKAALLALLRNFERDARVEVGWARLLVEFRTVALRDPSLNQQYAQVHRQTVARLATLIARLQAEENLKECPPPAAAAEFILAAGTGLTLERGANPRSLPSEQLLGMVLRAVTGSTQ